MIHRLVLDLTLPTPAENLALDEALLEHCTEHPNVETLRFWESPCPFVVLGHSNRTTTEVDPVACTAAQVPVLRRCTGGGTVLQGPGCLNYALLLRHDGVPQLATIPATNRFIMGAHRDVFSRLTGQPVEVRGITDLAIHDRKFSGNAQRRGRTHLLFHGTLLLHFELGLITNFLRMPPRQPAYRANRPHTDFVRNLDLETDVVKQALQECWQARTPFTESLAPALNQLMSARYHRPEWHQKF